MRTFRPKSNWMDDERLHVPTIDVFQENKCWRRTGLFDQHGNELMSRNYPEPIGFVTDFSQVVAPKPSRKKR